VGWIIYDYAFASEPWSYEPASLVTPPNLVVGGLAEGTYEAVWFDDRRGMIIDRVDPFYTDDVFVRQVPNTDPPDNPTGFGKSIAFLIQPVGYTPQRSFAALPNEPIGQILIDTDTGTPGIQLPNRWHEEKIQSPISQQTLRFVAKTRSIPALDVSQHKYVWRGYWHDGNNWIAQWDPPFEEDGQDYTQYQCPVNRKGEWRIEVDVFENTAEQKRVSGDIIHLKWSW
jgi:hypothetical protein